MPYARSQGPLAVRLACLRVAAILAFFGVHPKKVGLVRAVTSSRLRTQGPKIPLGQQQLDINQSPNRGSEDRAIEHGTQDGIPIVVEEYFFWVVPKKVPPFFAPKKPKKSEWGRGMGGGGRGERQDTGGPPASWAGRDGRAPSVAPRQRKKSASPAENKKTGDVAPVLSPPSGEIMALAHPSFRESGLSGRQAGDGDSVRGTTDVVEADFVAEHHAGRVAAVFAADADF